MTEYLTACVCTSGHLVSSATEYGTGSSFCPDCGEPTFTACAQCSAPLRGLVADQLSISDPPVHSYCYGCGTSYQWTARKLDGVAELAAAIDQLTDHERASLQELMPHLIQETPRTAAAGFKVAAIIQRAKGPAKAVLWDAVVSLTVDAGKKAMGLS